MADTRQGSLIEQAFIQYDEVVKRFVSEVPKQIQAAELDPPGGKKPEIKPLPFSPLGGI